MVYTIFGGTGNVGSQLVRQFLADNHKLRLVLRTPSKATQMFGENELLQLHQSDYLQMTISQIAESIKGSDVVVICSAAIRWSKFSDLFRWNPAPGNHPANYKDFIRALAAQCALQKIKLVYLSSWGVENPWKLGIAALNTFGSNSTSWHLEEERLLRATPGLNYAVVRPTKFANYVVGQTPELAGTPPTPNALRVSQADNLGKTIFGSGTMISIHNVAYALKQAVERDELSRTSFTVWDQDAAGIRVPEGKELVGWETLKPDSKPLPSNCHAVAVRTYASIVTGVLAGLCFGGYKLVMWR